VTKGLGDGKALWCPSFPVGSGRGIDAFSTPSYPSRNGNGEVVGTMLFNPRIQDAWGTDYAGANLNNLRAYPKTSSQWSGPTAGGPAPGFMLPGLTRSLAYVSHGGSHLFATDYIGAGTFAPNTFAHYPAQGFDCIFTDGSVQFVQSIQAFQAITDPGFLPTSQDEALPSPLQYDGFYNYLENGQ